MNDKYWMEKAYKLAEYAQSQGEVPVGAVLISGDNELISSGYNEVINTSDPTAHAEIVAIRRASSILNNYRLLNTTLYVTLEPCAMCAGALVHARVKRLVFAARDLKVGAAGSVCNLLKGHPWNHCLQIDEGPFSSESAKLLEQFFHLRRGA